MAVITSGFLGQASRFVGGASTPSTIFTKKVFDWVPMMGPTWANAVDITGNHAISPLSNMDPATDWVQRPAALSFGPGWALRTADGGDDFIDFGNPPETATMPQMSIGWWGVMNSFAPTGTELLVGKGADSPSNSYGFRLRIVSGGGGWGFEVSFATVQLRVQFDSSAKERIPANVPTFIMVTWNGGATASSSVIGYKNGFGPLAHFLDANASGARGNDGGLPLRIANHTDLPAVGSPDAYYSRVAIWSRVVTPAEVRKLSLFPFWGVSYVPGDLMAGSTLRDSILPSGGKEGEDAANDVIDGSNSSGGVIERGEVISGSSGSGGVIGGGKILTRSGRKYYSPVVLESGGAGEDPPGTESWVGMSQLFKTGQGM